MTAKKSMIGKSPRGKRAAESKLLCTGKLSDGKPCPKTVEKGKVFCLWHNPEDDTWGEIYAHLETTPPEQKTDIVLGFIKSHPEHKLELPVWNGQSADLTGVDLSNVDLQNAYLLKVNLQDAVLKATNLRGAFLAHANLQDALLEGANLQGANLIYATLQNSNLKNANLESADLKYANMNKVHLTGATCRHAKFLEAKLQGADLQDAKLQEADLIYAQLQNAYLNRAELMGAHLDKANLQGVDFGSAKLNNAFLYAADLREANLEFADLTAAVLNFANLQGADLHLTNLKGADLTEAQLQDVDMSIVQSMSNIYLSGAWLDRTRISLEKLGGSIGEEINRDYTAAKRGYLALKQNFDDLGDYEASSWAYRKERRMEKLEAREMGRAALKKQERQLSKLPWDGTVRMERDLKGMVEGYRKYVSDTIVEWLCDYGESVWRVISCMALLLFVVGPPLFSVLGGIEWNKEPALTHEYLTLSGFPKFCLWYLTYLLYTLDTMTTANFSGYQPATYGVKFMSGFFAIGGIVLAGLLGFVAGNRIRRS